MRILLKLVIDCDADAAWRALHSPRAVAELYGPLVTLDPLAPGLELFLSGENLSDSDYAYRPGYPMPGASFNGGASLKF